MINFIFQKPSNEMNLMFLWGSLWRLVILSVLFGVVSFFILPLFISLYFGFYLLCSAS